MTDVGFSCKTCNFWVRGVKRRGYFGECSKILQSDFIILTDAYSDGSYTHENFYCAEYLARPWLPV